MLMEQVLNRINNYYVVISYTGNIVFSNSTIIFPKSIATYLKPGMYFRILGSSWNNGLYQVPEEQDKKGELEKNKAASRETTKDESKAFRGTVWVLNIPQGLIDIVTDMERWQLKYQEVVNSPYSAESFGGYSYTKSSDEGAVTVWDAFKNELAPYKKTMFARQIDVKGQSYQDPHYRKPYNIDFRR